MGGKPLDIENHDNKMRNANTDIFGSNVNHFITNPKNFYMKVNLISNEDIARSSKKIQQINRN
jgi:hypothetical protein